VIVTYSPDGQESQRWEWDPDKVLNAHAEAIEKHFGDTWDKFKVAVAQGSAKARRLLLWHLLKQQHVTLRADDVRFTTGELTVEYSRSELVELRAKLATSRAVDDSDRDKMLAALDDEIEKAPADGGGEEGKALSPTSDGGTGWPSANSPD
jgi:hypothetical protein